MNSIRKGGNWKKPHHFPYVGKDGGPELKVAFTEFGSRN